MSALFISHMRDKSGLWPPMGLRLTKPASTLARDWLSLVPGLLQLQVLGFGLWPGPMNWLRNPVGSYPSVSPRALLPRTDP